MKASSRTFFVAAVCMLVTGGVSAGAVDASTPIIGWLHGACIGLPDPDVRAGAPVTVVELGSPETVVAASIAGKAPSGDTCYPLMDGRREANLAAGLTFYRLDLPQPVELGIGLVPVGADHPLPTATKLDLNHDGRRDTFAHCATSEGVQFSIWPGAPYAGEPLWRGYYYLGYDVQADCPNAS